MELRLRLAAASLTVVALPWTAHGRASVALVTVVAAWGVLRQRRLALPLGVAAGTATAIAGMSWHEWFVLGAGLATIVLVLWARTLLVGATDPTRRAVAARTAAIVPSAALVAGMATVLLFPTEWQPTPTPATALREVTDRLVGTAGPLSPSAPQARLLQGGLPTALAAAVVIAVLMLLLPSPPDPRNDDDWQRVVNLVAISGTDSLAPFAARTDKRYVFSPEREAAVGYRTVMGVGLASGDAVGHRLFREAAFRAFVEHCVHQGWAPAVIGAGGHTAVLGRRFGFHVIKIGDEAVVDVGSFILDVPPMRNVRQAVQRSRNFGVTVSFAFEDELSGPLRSELSAVAARSHKGVPGRGFSMIMDGFLEGIFPGALVVYCRDADGAAVGMQRYLPYGRQGLSLDTMYRVPGSPNGVNERMIVETIAWAKTNGFGEISLNFAAFRSLYDRNRSLVEDGEYWLAHRLDPLVSVESIYRFNAKFRPRWRPRYVLFKSPAHVMSILPAALLAEFSSPPTRDAHTVHPGAPAHQVLE